MGCEPAWKRYEARLALQQCEVGFNKRVRRLRDHRATPAGMHRAACVPLLGRYKVLASAQCCSACLSR